MHRLVRENLEQILTGTSAENPGTIHLAECEECRDAVAGMLVDNRENRAGPLVAREHHRAGVAEVDVGDRVIARRHRAVTFELIEHRARELPAAGIGPGQERRAGQLAHRLGSLRTAGRRRWLCPRSPVR